MTEKLAFCVSSNSPLHQQLLRHPVRPSAPPYRNEVLSDIALEAVLRSVCFLDRSFCETEPYFKQIIPYVMVTRTHEGVKQVLTYVRGDASGEARLKAALSIGFGGHMDDTSEWVAVGGQMDQFLRYVLSEARRELVEELGDSATGHLNFFYHGALADDSTATVHAVHLGLLFETTLPDLKLESAEPDTITQVAWLDVEKLRTANADTSNNDTFARLELWSRRALATL
jgi:predicted NUDIX family phosphoesterase